MKTFREQFTAEFVGTFALVFIGAGASTILGLRPDTGAILGIALAHGLVLAIMISNLGHISGGHFNPAVTVSVWVAGKIETGRALAYIVAQAAGAAAGAGLLRLVMPERLWRPTNLGLTQLRQDIGITTGKGLLLEAILTFFLVFTVFAVAIDDRGVFKSIAGLPIGLVLTFDILVGGFLTGASMNPARSFGPAVVVGDWKNFWVYVAGPLAGGIIAASVYWFSFLRGRTVAAPRTETPIGGGPEEELPMAPGAEELSFETEGEEEVSATPEIPEEPATRPSRPYEEPPERPARPYGEPPERPSRPYGEPPARPAGPYTEPPVRPTGPYGEPPARPGPYEPPSPGSEGRPEEPPPRPDPGTWTSRGPYEEEP